MTATATKQRKTTKTAADAVSDIDRLALRRALDLASKVVARNPAKPVLANVLLANNQLVATDLEVRLEVPLAHARSILLPHGRLSAIVREVSAETVSIQPSGDTTCTIVSGRAQWTLPTEHVSFFPAWAASDSKPLARLPAEVLRRMLRAVDYATDTDSSRYALGGVLLEMKAGELAAVATDGRRLAVATADVDQATDDRSVVVPARAVSILEAMLGDDEGGVQLEVAGGELVAECSDGSRLIAKLLDGRFPRWRDVIPAGDGERGAANASELLSAVRQAAIVSTEESKGVAFAFDGDELTLTGRSSANGESVVTCPLLQPCTSTVVKLDPAFVMHAIRAADPDEPIEIRVTTPSEAAVFYSGSITAVIMPMAAE